MNLPNYDAWKLQPENEPFTCVCDKCEITFPFEELVEREDGRQTFCSGTCLEDWEQDAADYAYEMSRFDENDVEEQS